jgi:tetratricopeptide (TPR) repeat protein
MEFAREEAQHRLPGIDELNEALENLLADPDFHASARNKRFLRYVVEEQLAGRGARIKAYSIATEIFGRPDDFDPASDPIVRIEATRLRTALSEYYAKSGDALPMRISIPKGAYTPRIQRTGAFPASDRYGVGEASTRFAERDSVVARPGWASSSWVRGAAGALGAVLIVGGIVLTFFYRFAPADLHVADKPVLLIGAQTASGEAMPPAFVNGLLEVFSKFERWQIRTYAAALDDPSTRSTYSLSLRAGQNRLWWTVSDAQNGEVIAADHLPFVDGAIPDGALGDLADHLGGNRGVILANEALRQFETSSTGYGCIARMETEISIWDRRDRLPIVEKCLRDSLTLQSDNPGLLSALARVTLRMTPLDGPPPEVFAAVEQWIARAQALQPGSSQTELALTLLKFRWQDFAGAAEAGLRAHLLNPSDRAIRSYAGMALFTSGRLDEGSALMREAESRDFLLAPEIHAYLAFDDFRRGNYSEAIKRANMAPTLPSFCFPAIRAASLVELGDFASARQELQNLVRGHSWSKESFVEALTVRGIDSRIQNKLISSLQKLAFAQD